MRKALFAVSLPLALVAGLALADVIEMPEGEPTPEIILPAKGTTMGDVERKYGQPRTRHAAVGGDAPQHPPITRWDYDAFTVVFEKDRVIDAVIPGAPPRLQRTEGLAVAPDAPAAAMAPATPDPAAPAPAEPPASPEAPTPEAAAPEAGPSDPAQEPTAP